MLLLLLASPYSHPWPTRLRMTALLVAFPNSHPRPTLLWMTTRLVLLLLLASPSSHPRPTLLRMAARLLHLPSLPNVNGRHAVRATTAQDERKRQRKAALLLAPQDNTEAGT